MRACLLVMLVLGAVAAEPVTATIRPDGVDLSCLTSFPGVSELNLDGRAFSVLELPGAGVEAAIGAPRVPIYRRLVEVPLGAAVTVEVDPVQVAEQDLELPLVPVQPSVPKSGSVPTFAFDDKVYATPGFGADIGADVAEAGEMRGHRLVLVTIRPLSYDPVLRRIRHAGRLNVRLRWSGADPVRTRRMHERYDSPAFRGRLDGVCVNAEAFAADGPPRLPVGYLIIVPDAWQTSVQPLAEWRRRRGWRVFVRNLTEVGGGQANAVKAYIQNAYDNWPVPPSMVMLVGDVDRIGYFTGQGQGSPPTDLNYAMLAGSDYFPDIDLCRASVTSAAQLDSLVAKTIRYEQNTGAGGTAWLKRAYFIASADGANHQVAEATHQYCMRKLRHLGVVCDSIWLYYNQGIPIATAVNSGRSWVTYSGHGNTNCWADPTPSFDLAAVHALENTDLVPWVQTYACLSGDYTSLSYPECFSEAWIRNGRRGAIAHMASTVTSYWTEDDTLERRVFDFMYDSLYCWVGGGMNKAKLKYYEQMGNNSTTRRYFEMYNIIGDGAIDVYWQEPAEISATYPPVIPLGAYPLSVTVQRQGLPVRDALVCAMAKNDTTVFASAYTDASGQVVLDFVTGAPDSIRITVTGHNLAPHLGGCLAVPTSGPYVTLLRALVDDSSGGNGDGIVNPGETINLPAWLRNWGSAAASDVRTWLRTTDPNITLLDTVKSYGTVAAGDSAFSGMDGFGFGVAQACTNGYPLRFVVVAKDASDSTWASPLTLVVGAPVLGYVSNRADDPPPGGNGNGMIEPGETADLLVTLRNAGLGHAYNVTAVLRSGDARLSVLDSSGTWTVIMRDSVATSSGDRFRVRADGSLPRETQVPCTLYLSVGGVVQVRQFNLGIGEIRVCDPIPDNAQPTRFWAYDDTDTLYSGHPRFNWVEIRGLGTRLSLSDDQTVTISLPSSFGPWVYYGRSYTQVSVCSNGWVAPGATTITSYSNTPLPNTDMPPAVFLNWDDLYPPAGNGVWYYHDEDNHRFIVEYDSVRYYSGTNFEKNQMVIYDTTVSSGENDIMLQYLTANQTVSATVGLQDDTKTIAIQVLCDGQYHRGADDIVPSRAIRFSADHPIVGMEEEPVGAGDATGLAFVSCGPNPLRGSAGIGYTVPRAGRVSLGVYNAAGRKVATLFAGMQPAGFHAATWHRCDDEGQSVSQGIYFYRLEADGARLVRKVVVLD